MASFLAPAHGSASRSSRMEFIRQLIDITLHLDSYLNELVAALGMWSYAILFLVVFCETGLVVTPILPGESGSPPSQSHKTRPRTGSRTTTCRAQRPAR